MDQMKQSAKILNRLKGLNDALSRYPLTSLMLLFAAVLNAVAIETDRDFLKILLALAVGSFLGAAAQAVYERFYDKNTARLVLLATAAALTAGYYLIILPAPKLGEQIGVRTAVALFALLIAFIWLPAIRSGITFNESFMAAFKALFVSLFYSGVIFAGVSLLVAATDRLLFRVGHTAYIQSANIIFVLFAPVYFLSLIPLYPGALERGEEEEKVKIREENIKKAVNCPRFLEILISYIIIPLTSVFTVILILYIILNIRSSFWTDNLLEPMLVSYSITVILVYILASRLENRFAHFFRLIFPKVLIPIVFFQLIASVLNANQSGITYARYYVILYGIFAAAAGVVLSLVPVAKNGLVAAMLIAFSAFSILPPVDAFSVSRVSQENMLKDVLFAYGMLQNGVISPNPAVPQEDRDKIVKAVQYLDRMGYNEQIDWLPDDIEQYDNFYKTFGFYEYTQMPVPGQNVYLTLPSGTALDIGGYDRFAGADLYTSDSNVTDRICDIGKNAKTYILERISTKEDCRLSLKDESGNEVISLPTRGFFESFSGFDGGKSTMTAEQATFTNENDRAKITIVAQNMQVENLPSGFSFHAYAYILITIK